MWLHSVARRAARSTSATTRSPSCSSPATGSSTSTWSSPRRSTSVTVAAQSPDSQRDHAGVVDLAAAGGVERRLDELDQQAAVLLRDGADRRRLLDGLVAVNVGVEAAASANACARSRSSSRPPRPALARARVR